MTRSRSSLSRMAPLMRDAQPVDDGDRRAMFRHAWQHEGLVVFREADVPALFWAAIVAMAERVYGKRGA